MAKPSATYKTIELKIPAKLLDSIRGVTKTPGSWQRPFQRIRDSLRKSGDDWVARVRDEDLRDMKEMARDPGEGGYERWAADILELNGIAPNS